MDNLQPYLGYIGIGLGIIGGALLLIWLVLAFIFFRQTRGLTNFLTDFFGTIALGRMDEAYANTTAHFQQTTTKQQFRKWAKQKKIQQFKRLTLPMPKIEGDRYTLDLTIIIESGREIPVSLSLVRQDKTWKIDALDSN